jgi:hypothetical protein
MSDIFRSSRLVYRAYEVPDDDAWFELYIRDPDVSTNALPYLPRPTSSGDTLEIRKRIVEKYLLCAVICKIPESESKDTASASAGAGKKDEAGDVTETEQKEMESPKPIPIGVVGLKSPDPPLAHHRSAMMAIFLNKAFHGNGYGPEAIKWTLNWAFEIAGLHRVSLGVLGWNKRARRVYEQMGFVTEGVFREEYWFRGKWWDTTYMSILAREWEEGGRRETTG